mmetsp:Transcript_3739/g.10289  ORF Transcript_3739/g.10289 Transcript_3739/m.10289 type:complete len:295 (-) Transcript_3739:3170-4054(-)
MSLSPSVSKRSPDGDAEKELKKQRRQFSDSVPPPRHQMNMYTWNLYRYGDKNAVLTPSLIDNPWGDGVLDFAFDHRPWSSNTWSVENGFALLSDGSVKTQRRLEGGVKVKFDTDMKFSAVSSNIEHSAGILSNGQLVTWGYNTEAQLGIGSKDEKLSNVFHMPKIVSFDHETSEESSDSLHSKILRFNGISVKQVACGSCFTVALSLMGAVFSWGANGYTGHGTSVDDDGYQATPKKIEAFDNIPVSHISTNDNQSAACSFAGEVYTWGFPDASVETGRLERVLGHSGDGKQPQ